MEYSKQGDFKKCFLLLLLFLYFTTQHCQTVEAVADDEYPVLSKNQELFDDSTDPRTKFVSSLSHLLEQDEEGKRSSSFFPLRGKKTTNIESNIADQYQYLPDPDDKRSQFYPLRGKKIPFDLKRASYFMPMRGRKDDNWDNFSEDDNSEDKRASSFMPMRGKKRSSGSSNTYQQFGKSGMYDSIKTDITLPSSSGSNRTEVQSSVPVRGREFDQSEKVSRINETQLRNKRSISFTPMRGRRLLSDSEVKPEEELESIVPTLVEKKAYAFMPMRGRRESLFKEADSISTNNKDNFNGVEKDNTEKFQDNSDLMTADDKRASSFMPMRGRKQDQSYNYFDPLQPDKFDDKRKMSFMPMRVRKDSDNDSYFIDTDNKRASSFMPMRGRRTLELEDYESKRASSFMPMRGRRSLETIDFKDNGDKRASSFMPMRGRRDYETLDHSDYGDKRASYFMPMRGRRDYETLNHLDYGDKRASSFMPMRGRRDYETLDHSDNGDKRASSFMPMRGRRSIANFGLDDTQGLDYLQNRYSFAPTSGRRLLSDSSDDLEKRTYAFTPMRGRRAPRINYTDAMYIDEYEMQKRGYAFMPMRGRRFTSDMDQANYYYHAYPFFMPAGIGSALISRPFGNRDLFINSIKAAASKNRRQYDWESVKRAFHATRGKRIPKEYSEDVAEDDSEHEEDQIDEKIKSDISLLENFRLKRNIFQPQVFQFQPQRKYIALKRPMSFFATRGKRFDDSSNERITKLP